MGLFLQLEVALLSSRAGVCQCPYEAFYEFLQDSGAWLQVLSVLKTTFFHLLRNRDYSKVKPEIKLYKITVTNLVLSPQTRIHWEQKSQNPSTKMSKVIYSFSLKVGAANCPLNMCPPLSLHTCKAKKISAEVCGEELCLHTLRRNEVASHWHEHTLYVLGLIMSQKNDK